MKISGVYKITNVKTNDCYIGSSKDVKNRWAHHKCPSVWKKHPNNPLYLDMQKYGVDKFDFQILVQMEPEQLKKAEQEFIEKLKPTYNNYRAKGWNIERYRKNQKEYQKKSERYKEYQKKYRQSEKKKENNKKYYNQLCSYNGEILKLNTLSARFRKIGIEHPTIEARKYLLDK